MDPVTLTYVSLAVAGVGAASQFIAAQDQKSAMKRSAAESRAQFDAQQRIADIKNARERATMARQARITRGNIEQQGANAGVSTSTGVLGGVASVDTQEATNVGVFGAIQSNQQDILSSQARQGQAQADIGQAQADSIIGSTIFSIGSTGAQLGGGFKTIFDANKTK